jgi:hypothetical protein
MEYPMGGYEMLVQWARSSGADSEIVLEKPDFYAGSN